MYDYLTVARLQEGINQALADDDASRVVDLIQSLDAEIRYGRMAKRLYTAPAKPKGGKSARNNSGKGKQ